MADTGKVLVFYRETKVVCLDDDVVIVDETPEGITVRHTYRKGTRQEFIPRDKLDGIVYEDIKPNRKPKKAKVAAKPKQAIVVEAEVTVEGTVEPTAEPAPEPVEESAAEEEGTDDTLSESESFDDEEEDDFFDDEFE